MVKHFIPFFKKGLLISVMLSWLTSEGQIDILPGPGVTPVDMVENIVGEGIIYDNVTFQGAPGSRGIFTNGQTTNLGIASGIFLTSGAGYVIPGPNSSCYNGVNNGYPGHPALNAITTSTTYDAAVLEFDFIPESDTLRFKYVFGSEEYNEWVGSSYNDVFGYFVSGPNPQGGFYADKNIAIVPGTTNTSVKINSVNFGYSNCGVVPTGPCTNCAYYDDNTGGISLEYDGFTVVMIAWIMVVPCETYHIKIGVADAGDGIYDSGVFIEENSFESPKIEVETDPYPQGVSENMIEGCVEADIIFRLPNPEYAPITVCFEITGTAINKVDYDSIPNCVTFEEGQDSAVIHVVPIKDGQLEGEETIILIIENTLGCIVRYDTVQFTIIDYMDMVTQMSPSTMICQGQSIDIWVNTVAGIPPYTFNWEGFSVNNDTLTVSPDATTTYFVNVTDLCLDTVSDSVKVTVFPTPDIDLGSDSVIICEGDSLILHAGGGYINYAWQDGSNDSTYVVTEGGLYKVIVTGPGGCLGGDSIMVNVSVVSVDLGEDTTICVGESVVFDAGGGFLSYVWQDGSQNQQYTANETGFYWVQVGNGDCTDIDSVYLYVDDPAVGLFIGNDTTICTNDEIILSPGGVYNSYLWSTGDTTSTISVSLPGTYTLNVISGCGTASDQIIISNWPYPDPNLMDDTTLCFGGSVLLEPTTGFLSYVWQDNSSNPNYMVTQNGIYIVNVTDFHGCQGSDTVFVDIASIVDLGVDSLNLCTGSTLTLDAGNDFDYYTWNGTGGGSTLEVTTGGMYIIDVNYSFGCPSEDWVYVSEYPVPVASITGENQFCTGDTVTLQANSGNFTYTWYLDNNPISNNPSIVVNQGGNYSVTLENLCGTDTEPYTVQENGLPNVYLGDDVTLFPGESVTLEVVQGYPNYIWNDIPGTSNTFTVSYDNIVGDTTIQVEVIDGNNCKNSDEILVEVYNVKVHNVITANGDGRNDRFKPDLEGWSGINEHMMTVFNRWGEKVWESSNFPDGWDGKKNGKYVADGTYYWVLEVFYGPQNLKKVYKGSLTVLGSSN
jgi:gliding motility-associated-like protein